MNDPLSSTPFRALRHLGEGTMGVVYEAEHRLLGHRVVVKVLRAERATDPSMADRLRLEAQAAASLRDNPHIVQVSDLGCTADGRPYLVMEKLEGRDLGAEVAARGPLPVVEAVALARQLLAGLAAAHAIGIVHRDIKPANLFLCASGGGAAVLKILDFGIAKVLDTADPTRAPTPLTKATQEGMTLGTPHYLSPEQALGRPVDARSDVYAVGAVLYWLLAGRSPFEHQRGVYAVMRAHLMEQPVPPSSLAVQPISAALEGAVLKALAKQPSDRFETAESFSAELARVAEGGQAPGRWPRTEPLDTRAFQAAVQARRERQVVATDAESRRDSSAETLRWPDAKPTVELPVGGRDTRRCALATAALPASPTLAPPPGAGARPTASTSQVGRRGLLPAALVVVAFALALVLIFLVRAFLA
jgi:eukaryotic-like serine/threonine-protein kinase